MSDTEGTVLQTHQIEASGPIEGIQGEPQAQEAAQTADQAESQPQEQPKEEPKAESKQDDRLASKFAALSRKDKELRKKELALQQQTKAMEAKIKEFEEKMKSFSSIEEQLKADPLAWLEQKGLSYKDLTEKYVLKPDPTPEEKQNSIIERLNQKIDALENSLKQRDEDSKKSAEEAKARQIEQAKANYIKDLTDFVNKGGDNYDLIRKNDAVQLVYDVIEEHYNHTLEENGEGEILDMERAANEVENYLLDEAKKLIESNKLKSLFVPQQTKQEPKESRQSVTLSNTVSQQVPSKGEPFLSEDESKRRMAAMLKWNS